ncbi:glycosyltransferase [Candidatus Methylocalor cossyra]|uniref:Glycosyltransferase, GT2 family n=1 Tax=Candidatus Methylocalor cossyra TaxID=3108543 RepID=A0ABM9NG34_9GAMM
MKPISVIIVNFNAGSLLSDCVRSVLASTVPVEIIVSDNRSTDASLAELRRSFPGEPRLTIIENPRNLGFAKANNVALPWVRGDFILFLNPDCIIRPNTLAGMLEALAQHPQAAMAGCLIRNPDGSEQAGCRRSVPTPWRTFIRLTRLSRFAKYHSGFESYLQTGLPVPKAPATVEAISGAFMLVRRSAIETVGPMDEGYFMHCEDLDWCMRFRQAGLDILFVPHVEILHVGGVCSASRPISVEYYKHKGMVRFYRKYFRDRYPVFLTWIVLTAVGIRFLLRSAVYLITRKPLNSYPKTKSGFPRLVLPKAEGSDRVLEERRAIVTGATSLIGDFLLPALIRAGYEVHAVSRNPHPHPRHPQLHWHQCDISSARLDENLRARSLIHLAPLWTLPPLIPDLARRGVRRIIAFSSTSRFTKHNSGYEKERILAQKLVQSEEELDRLCRKLGIHWTIFRPTLVYSLGRDKNITTIARFIGRFGFFPLVGEGTGLRQPVHAEDLALACLGTLDNPRAFDKAYNLSGGETLMYREMVRRVFEDMHKEARIVSIPLVILRILLRSLSCLPLYRHFTPEMANRINQDMVFDHASATEDFGFAPRRFRLIDAPKQDWQQAACPVSEP